MLRLSPSTIATLYKPSECEKRVLLRHKRTPEAEPSPFDEVIRRLGREHESRHIQTLGQLVEIAPLPREQRVAATLEAIRAKVRTIYQPHFQVRHTLEGREVEIEGIPDLMVRHGSGYIIRDVKMARKIDHHPEIVLQVQLYGWLYEQSFGNSPQALEVCGGTGEISQIPYDGGQAALAELSRIVRILARKEDFYEPVGWSKCNSCAFHQLCWTEAEQSRDVAVVLGVEQAVARKLREAGCNDAASLLAQFDEAGLSALKCQNGSRKKAVGKKARSILLHARALCENREFVDAPPALPQGGNFVMFDLEGMPPHLDEIEKVYLWGTKVFGTHPGQFHAAVSDFGEEGDRAGWLRFLDRAAELFERYGDIRFLHWHKYESIKLRLYIDRFGDVRGIARRVQSNLVDLHKITEQCMVLPLPSRSLKVIEKHIGYKRTLKEFGGSWSMAKFIEATETRDTAQRQSLMNEILKYNEEDLDATWAIFQWLQAKAT